MPLTNLLASQIDFDRVNRCRQLKLFLTANVRTGRPTIVRQPNLTVDTVLASACLPFVFQAVEIDGEEYWDGGYTGNPALFPLVDECRSRDLVIVQINPFVRAQRPRAARDILNRLNELTFHSSPIKELRAIVVLKELIEAEHLDHERYRDMLIHRIHAGVELENLSVSSILILAPALASLAVLFDGGAPLLASCTRIFMRGAGDFIVRFFPLFLPGAIVGKLMDDSGPARGLAEGFGRRGLRPRHDGGVVLMWTRHRMGRGPRSARPTSGLAPARGTDDLARHHQIGPAERGPGDAGLTPPGWRGPGGSRR